MLKEIIIKCFPSLGRYKRLVKAYAHSISTPKKSYSQHGEDVIIFDILKSMGEQNGIYVDVGANHPSDISNTYLLYRKGYKGICVEPNKELIKLHRLFRKRDIQLAIGCAEQAAVLEFFISPTPVISSFRGNNETKYYKREYVPVMRLDDALGNMEIEQILLLSIDVEGMNYKVLSGAVNLLKKCTLACIEFEDEAEKKAIANLMLENDFILVKEIACNLLYCNKAFYPKG
jgi:FkbM family methyltransferase